MHLPFLAAADSRLPTILHCRIKRLPPQTKLTRTNTRAHRKSNDLAGERQIKALSFPRSRTPLTCMSAHHRDWGMQTHHQRKTEGRRPTKQQAKGGKKKKKRRRAERGENTANPKTPVQRGKKTPRGENSNVDGSVEQFWKGGTHGASTVSRFPLVPTESCFSLTTPLSCQTLASANKTHLPRTSKRNAPARKQQIEVLPFPWSHPPWT